MIDFYFWTTPNGYKVLIFLEESEMPYRILPINISKGEHARAISIFESGAILLYLAEKSGRFLPYDVAGRTEVIQWLFWQMAGLGPMLGQNLHFGQYAAEKIPYAIDRYVHETSRLFKVLDSRLIDRDFIAGDYSIADMACYPWVFKHPFLQIAPEDFANLNRWYGSMAGRPAVKRAYEIGASINTIPTVTEGSRKYLFNQKDRSVAA